MRNKDEYDRYFREREREFMTRKEEEEQIAMFFKFAAVYIIVGFLSFGHTWNNWDCGPPVAADHPDSMAYTFCVNDKPMASIGAGLLWPVVMGAKLAIWITAPKDWF